MKRRDFLKILGIAPAIAAVPALANTDKTNWKHAVEAGRLMDAADIPDNYLDAVNKSIARTADALLDVIPNVEIDGAPFDRVPPKDNKYHAYIDGVEIPIEEVMIDGDIHVPAMGNGKGEKFTLISPPMNFK